MRDSFHRSSATRRTRSDIDQDIKIAVDVAISETSSRDESHEAGERLYYLTRELKGRLDKSFTQRASDSSSSSEINQKIKQNIGTMLGMDKDDPAREKIMSDTHHLIADQGRLMMPRRTEESRQRIKAHRAARRARILGLIHS